MKAVTLRCWMTKKALLAKIILELSMRGECNIHGVRFRRFIFIPHQDIVEAGRAQGLQEFCLSADSPLPNVRFTDCTFRRGFELCGQVFLSGCEFSKCSFGHGLHMSTYAVSQENQAFFTFDQCTVHGALCVDIQEPCAVKIHHCVLDYLTLNLHKDTTLDLSGTRVSREITVKGGSILQVVQLFLYFGARIRISDTKLCDEFTKVFGALALSAESASSGFFDD